MYGLFCRRQNDGKPCTRRSCLAPAACGHLQTSQSGFADLIRMVCGLEAVKHVSVNSGVRMDLALLWPEIIEVVAKKATGGQLSVAPEYLARHVLQVMGKPEETGWQRFEELFSAARARANNSILFRISLPAIREARSKTRGSSASISSARA
jgi:hypothetical protein